MPGGAGDATRRARMTPRYRPDIDGLRAIAVVPVVLYHVGIGGFPGGFVGVDVFFTISGYLIGQILVAEIDGGTFSLLGFYERRARRILPALFACIGATLLVGRLVLAPDAWGDLWQGAAACALFVSNFWFHAQAESYFDGPAAAKPLLHTWSLAVEEQFYLVLPVLLVVLGRIAREPGPRWPIRAIGLLALAAASLVFAVRATTFHPLAGFYLLPGRLWELLAGTLLALAPRREWPRPIAEGATLAGLAMIVVPVLAYGATTPFPGLAALPPVLGAALIIAAGSGQQSAATTDLLGARPLRAVGLVSYSLYLWHVPVIALSRASFGADLPLAAKAAMLVVSAALAWASWRWIEQPFRASAGEKPAARLLKGYAAALGIAALCLVAAGFQIGMIQRGPAALVLLWKPAQEPLYDDCFDGLHVVRTRPFCLRGAPGRGASFALIGDSHGEALAPGIFAAAEAAGVAGLQVTQSGWRPLHPWLRSEWEDADLGKAPQVRRVLADPAIRKVLLVVSWSSALGESYHREDSAVLAAGERVVPETLATLIRKHPGKHFVLVSEVPVSEAFGLREQAQADVFGRRFDPAVPRARQDEDNARIVRLLAPVTRLPNVSWLDLTPAMCDALRCPGARDGRSQYVDAGHVTPAYARSLAPVFAPAFR